MQENVVAKGKHTAKEIPFQKIKKITLIVAAVILVLGLISSISDGARIVENHECGYSCFKWGCDYEGGALSVGLEMYFNGGFLLPLLVLAGGFGYCGIMKKRNASYEMSVTKESVEVVYGDEKTISIPLCSIFTAEKINDTDLEIVTSENSYNFRNLEGVDEVCAAINELMPEVSVKGPANNEQVLAKGYPPAIKPLLMVLMILVGAAALIGALASEEFGVLLVGVIPFAIVLVFYLLAKTPYLVVTDKRVFYVSDFGRKLSLPLNKITVTVTHQWFKQLHIAAPVGRIHLFWVKNTSNLYDIINALLNEKQ